MASALMILFLGCWLAGQSGVSGQTYYSKPSISLSPSTGVTPGGAVTIQCRGRYQNMRFLLYKDGNSTALQVAEPAGNLAEFSIRSVRRRDAGSYRCRYSNKTDLSASSHPSDPVELVVAEGTDPAGTQQPDPPTTKLEGEGGTDPTPLRMTTAPTQPGSAGPGPVAYRISLLACIYVSFLIV
ncbi:platelet glycoprotein VI-like [Mauremys reevesii]|uniref:platelet glycoprotein VI-like n=1 Tax=Mauremys reevesii TaxID=260615 RepID=UPI00194018C3|nr:platelet glycoprotein VI-like [Mauremys reevesii]XP_039366116.1 platelet glycoprotein VI-like [Mauremys reevesii]